MNLERVEKIAEAVLYEGYMLYPYRASAVKNQQRWNFGVLCPRSYSEQQNGSDAWMMQTECILESSLSTRLNIEIRFLQIVNRTIGKLAEPISDLPRVGELEFQAVERLQVGNQTYAPWQEAMERKRCLPPLDSGTSSFHRNFRFRFKADRELEPIRNEDGLIAGVIIREWQTLAVAVDVEVSPQRDGLSKLTLRMYNLTPIDATQISLRADALMQSLVSAHTILAVEGGEYVSLLDPPDALKDLATECKNVGTWPVMVGEEGARNVMLSSPIILYDYPQIAPESPGSLFDGTEIDEILSLRILTLTEEEKNEMRQSDERSRAILERTENMPPEQFMKLHGVLRGLRPLSEEAQ
jgi:hypothetical protein